MEENDNKVVQINIENIIKSKNEKVYRMLPRFIINYIRRIIHEDEVNDILKRYHGQDGISFTNGLMKEFNVTFNIHNENRIPARGKLIVVSNHPLGGFDGLTLISLVSRYRKDIKFPVNDFLMNIPNLRDIFVPINKVGNNSIHLARQFDKIFASDSTILYFPAGICSRKINNVIQDLEWKKTFVDKAKEYARDIVPVYFNGQNSNFFYNLARIRKKLHIKANLEMIYLVDEFMKQRNSSYHIHIGDLIHYESLTPEKTNFEWAQEIRKYVYSLSTL
ncbi:MAG: 1-acyl-sn-glycerol-3-phosphate acyltransferase [Bacteroidales bacterium]|jgi:1-acyl-sn-glycerol-3-phosphate acyltransferase|nr:1-acyl-sn-glycerol-3-phosphate acyltransferase [Bacteroidales bacterium]